MSDPKLQSVLGADPGQVATAITQVIDEKYPAKIFTNPDGGTKKVSLGWMLSHTLGALDFEFAKAPLKLLNDDHFDTSKLPPGCFKQQAAIQDIPKRHVDIDLDLVSKMSFLEQGLLNLHESKISLRNQPGADTTPIRKEIADLVQNSADLLTKIIRRVQVEGAGFNPKMSATVEARMKKLGCTYDEDEKMQLTLDVASGDFRHTPKDAAAAAACPVLRAKQGAEYQSQDRDQAKPTLLSVPAQFQCSIVNETRNDLNAPFEIGTKFSVTRISGDGRPNDIAQSQNLLRFDDSPVGVLATRAFFNTHRHETDSLFPSKYGEEDISMTWIKFTKSADLTLFLDHYNKMTNEFVGSIQEIATGADVSAENPFTAFGVICVPSEVNFGIDMDQSF